MEKRPTFQMMFLFLLFLQSVLSLLDGGHFGHPSSESVKAVDVPKLAESPGICSASTSLNIFLRSIILKEHKTYPICPITVQRKSEGVVKDITKNKDDAPVDDKKHEQVHITSKDPSKFDIVEPTLQTSEPPLTTQMENPPTEKEKVVKSKEISDDLPSIQGIEDHVVKVELISVEEEASKQIEHVEDKKEHIPYIVKAIPQDSIPSPKPEEVTTPPVIRQENVEETLVDSLNHTKDSIEEDKFTVKESAVDEELLESTNDTVEETIDIIAPFSQWAEKKLEEEEKKIKEKESDQPETPPLRTDGIPNNQGAIKSGGAPKTNGKVILTKNFASPDCSAKIVGANSESQGAGNVITHSRDEYFLNKCSDRSWFVVELCESIKALKVQMANYELYSSSPDELRVSIGSTFPGRDKDWVEFGTFHYQDERVMQTFKNEQGVVGKYVKVEVLSHHGSEHYCPISVFKVLGISEIDLITEDDIEDGDEDEPAESVDDELSEHIIVKTIKEAVHKVVNVFRPQNRSIVEDSMNSSSLQGASLRYQLVPDNLSQENLARYHMIHYLLATQYRSVRSYTKIMGMEKILPYICPKYNIHLKVTEEYNQKLPWQWVKFVHQVHGEDFLVALCNVMSMEERLSPLIESKVNEATDTVVLSKEILSNDLVKDSSQVGNNSQNIVTGTNPTKGPSEEVNNDSNGSIASNKDIVIQDSKEINNSTEPNNVEKSDIIKSTESDQISQQTAGLSTPDGKIGSSGSTSPPQNVAQTTWQKLSSRIKALERNVTLSTGFLEELSRKYIKQIEELNTAVKVANDAIQVISKKEEQSRQSKEALAGKLNRLTNSMEQLSLKIETVQEEVMTRHGLLILLEVVTLALVFLICRPGGGKHRVVHLQSTDRKMSLDSSIRQKEELKKDNKLERRSSIEVGTLPNGQMGSMRTEEGGLTKKQRKRKRRRESAQSLRNLVEEESDMEENVYSTFHGRSTGGHKEEDRRRSSSLSRRMDQEVNGDISLAGEISPTGRFEVDQVWQEIGRPKSCKPSNAKSETLTVTGRQNVEDIGKVGQSKVRERVRKGSGIRRPLKANNGVVTNGANGQSRGVATFHNGGVVTVSNKYDVLDRTVQEYSCCTTETEDSSTGMSPRHRVGLINGQDRTKMTPGRSKSSSPNRQTNLLLRQQRERIRKFLPAQAKWLPENKNK